MNESTTNALLKSFDGKNWKFSSIEQPTDAETDSKISKVAAKDFCGAFLVNKSIDHITGQTELRFADGMLVSGQLNAISDGKAKIETNYAADPVTLSLDELSMLKFAPSATGDKEQEETKKEEMEHRLYTCLLYTSPSPRDRG